jgi:hypothetical protein
MWLPLKEQLDYLFNRCQRLIECFEEVVIEIFNNLTVGLLKLKMLGLIKLSSSPFCDIFDV